MGRYAYDLATGKLTQNVVWDGDPFIACDDEPRHVGASWPSTDWIQSLEWERDYAARELADAVIDQPTHIEWSRDYLPGFQPRCPECGVLMRTAPGRDVCPACGHEVDHTQRSTVNTRCEELDDAQADDAAQ